MGDCPLRAALCGEDATRAIRIAATRLSRTEGFQLGEADDLEGEIRLRILESADKFDPGRAGLRTYISRKAEWAAGQIGRDRRRLKRWGGNSPLSLDAPAHAGDHGRGTLADEAPGAPAGAAAGERLRTKIARVLAGAEPFDAAVARGLLRDKSENAIAAELRTTRRQVRNALGRLRELFEKSDITDF